MQNNSKERVSCSLLIPTKKWTQREQISLLGLLIVFIALSTYRIHSPGLYYDEMLFVSAATGKWTYLSWRGLPLMVFPYIGALKAWLYAPIFALFGVSALSIRLPAVLISCCTLVLGYSTVRRVLTPGWATAFTASCVVHPGFVMQSKVDWGPVVLMLFFKALCLYLAINWLGSSRPVPWSLIGACGLGFFDKFNFVWFIIALSGATLVVFGGEIGGKLRNMSRRATIILPIAIAAAGVLALWLIFPLLKSSGGKLASTRTSALWSLYQITTTGAATGLMWFKKPLMVPSWPGGAVMVGAVIFLLFYLLFSWRKIIRKSFGDTLVLRFCIWCLLMFAAVFAQIVFTPQAGGPHHTVMLFPLDLLACFAAAFLLITALPLAWRFPAILLESIFFFMWAGMEVHSLQSHFSRFGQANSFWGRWSPRIEQLAKYLNVKGRNVPAIYCVEWGIGNQLAALCQPEIGRKIRDNWPTFQDWSAQKEDPQPTVARFFPAQEKDLYVSFSKSDAVFPLAQTHFAEMESLAGKVTQPATDLPPEIGKTYQVFESRKR